MHLGARMLSFRADELPLPTTPGPSLGGVVVLLLPALRADLERQSADGPERQLAEVACCVFRTASAVDLGRLDSDDEQGVAFLRLSGLPGGG